MEIDPVLLLAEELRGTERVLHAAVRKYEDDRCSENGEAMNRVLGSLKRLHRTLFETVPTSALGAAELVRMVAERLPFTYATASRHFHEIADRLAAGRREHADLVWLRAMRSGMADGLCGENGRRAAPLLGLALLGATQPVIVFRAVKPPLRHPEEDLRTQRPH
jgi:hypothetical protein